MDDTAPYCFGRFSLDPAEPRLCADGVEVNIGITDLRLLLVLIEGAGAVVTKTELMSRVWGNSIVGDNALHVHMTTLRKALGEEVITTKRGVGYRFAAEFSRENPQPAFPAGNLPAFWTTSISSGPPPLIGRKDDLREVLQLLFDGRLVSLTGPGGVGKTSLALQAAHENVPKFRDGVWLVELSALNEGTLAASHIAAVLGLRLGQSSAPLHTLARLLKNKNLLIVLDNCEHIMRTSAEICEAILNAAPDVKILTTSREALSCTGEKTFAVPPLTLPCELSDTAMTIRRAAAIELFLERARGAVSNFQIDDEDIAIAARICRRVDGLPLAIEMVAGWAGILGLAGLDEKLDGSMKSWLRARSTAPPRHSTLAATLEWSHNLLSPAEQMVLRRVAVFVGNFTMHAAEAVVSDEAIPLAQVFEHVAGLIRKSMISVVSGSRPHAYRLLETTRAFMLEKLGASPEAGDVKQKHANHVLVTLRRAVDEWESSSDSVWLKRYESILPDLRAALDWAILSDTNTAIALAGAAWPLWREMSLHVEGRQSLNTVKSRIIPSTPMELEAQALRGLAELCLNTESVNAAHEDLLRAVSLFRETDSGADLGSALVALGYSALALGRIEGARSHISEGIALLQKAKRPRALAKAYSVQVSLELIAGCLEAASEAGAKAIRVCERAGADRAAFVVSANLFEATVVMGDLNAAIEAGVKLSVRLRSTPYSDVLGFVMGILTSAFIMRGDHDEALVAAREAITILRDEGMMFWLYDHLALRLALRGRNSDAALVAGYANAVFDKCGRPREPLGIRAVQSLQRQLRDSMSEADIKQALESGRQLTEDQAIALSLGL